jgi:hypothetical protein
MIDVSEDLVEFLRSRVDGGVVSVAFDPASDIDHADYDGANHYPQVAVVSEDPQVPGGGRTKFTGMDGGGAGPIQDVVVSVLVDCWGGPHDDDTYRGGDVHPDVVAAELATEVWETCLNAAVTGAPAGYEWIGAEPPQDADDTTRDSVHYRQQVVARLKHTYTP